MKDPKRNSGGVRPGDQNVIMNFLNPDENKPKVPLFAE